jgi:hypothetical protein
MNATIRLFKAVPLIDWSGGTMSANSWYIETINRQTIPKGFIFTPDLIAAFRGRDLQSLIRSVDELYGSDPEQLNKAFHKSFAKVRDASLAQLYVEQMVHYLTTYGAEAVGAYDADLVYIPTERLDAPPIDVKTFPLVVIRSMSHADLRVALVNFLSSGVALSEQTIADALEVAKLVRLDVEQVESVKNREVKIALYENLDIVPTSPVEFLRFVNYKATGSTLLIKNKAAVSALKTACEAENKGEGPALGHLFARYDQQVGVERLGEIFNRFKPLFLALRSDKALRPIINKIRRASEYNHKPLPVDFLNNVTASIKQAGAFGKGMPQLLQLKSELENPNVNIFRKIRLAQALCVRAYADIDSIVYKVRNGKSYVDDFGPLTLAQRLYAREAYEVVMRSIAQDIKPYVDGKLFYIPEGLVYGLPATEKQFTGNLPAGTYAYVPQGESLVAGVYWEDQAAWRVDLDLAVANVEGKIGWDGAYRTGKGDVLFSGDNTSAPNGASEVFYFSEAAKGSWLMSVNYYNFSSAVPVPFKIIVGSADPNQINNSFVLDPNRTLASAPAIMDTRQQSLGVITADPVGGHRFYFSTINTGGGISSRYDNNAERARRFTAAAMAHAPTLNDILLWAGAVPAFEVEHADVGLDLSPASIDKTTILSLLSGTA